MGAINRPLQAFSLAFVISISLKRASIHLSRENDTSQEPWEEPASSAGSEGETHYRRRPRTSRDAYNDPSGRIRQRPQQTGDPRDTGKKRPGPYEERPRRHAGPPRATEPRQQYDAYGRPRQGTRSPRESYETSAEPPRERPRQTRDSRERPVSSDKVDEGYQQRHRISRHSREEAYARLRQRPRQPGYSREEGYGAYPHTQQRGHPLIDPEVEEFDRRAARPRPRTQTTQSPARRQRRVWSTLLIGCIGGVITIALIVGVIAFIVFRTIPLNFGGIGKTSFTKQLPQQPLPISSSVKQLQIHNRVGNISITVDTNAPQGTLTAVKKVQAGNSSDAEKEFGRIAVDVKPGSDPSVLTVNATVPDTSVGSASDTVDMTIVLPANAISSPSSASSYQPFILNASTTMGSVSVANFNGVLTLTDDTGNISVKGGLLVAGSCLQTRIGDVTFAGLLDTALSPSLNPCSSNTTSTPTPGTTHSSQPWFSMKSGTGNINVTLNATSATNVLLDAAIYNKGKINSEFALNIQQNADGSASYYGPLIPNTSPTALMVLTVNTGNINLHKAA
jgi:hypothetical protein